MKASIGKILGRQNRIEHLKRVSRFLTSKWTLLKMTDDDHNNTAMAITFGCLSGTIGLTLILIWLCWRCKKCGKRIYLQKNYQQIFSTKKKVKLVFPGSFNTIHRELLTNFTLKLQCIDFVERSNTEIDPNKPVMVLCMCSTRVEDTCNIAMEKNKDNLFSDERKVVLVVFYKIIGSTTLKDVQMIGYQHKGVYKTVHVGFDDDNVREDEYVMAFEKYD
ncbi:hypothetical protein MAR_011645 [Mya arenaria]|uniref:Uncharacterized protein n=1 Tax=Mya arenaria TaxID=6604 RepID=A0ABY7FYX8_MYAAR|nr:hypothetical protein MAR_011645 [Mya arenaria]